MGSPEPRGWRAHKRLILALSAAVVVLAAPALIIAGDRTAGELLADVIVWALVLAVYCSPVLIARRRRVPHFGSIAVLNVFGFLVVTWVAALAMALRDPPQ